jgi:hypothetical protein
MVANPNGLGAAIGVKSMLAKKRICHSKEIRKGFEKTKSQYEQDNNKKELS